MDLIERPQVYEELNIAELAITHVFRDIDHERVGFVVQGGDKLTPLYVFVSDEQASELSTSFAQWLGDDDESTAETPGVVYSSGAEDCAAGGS